MFKKFTRILSFIVLFLYSYLKFIEVTFYDKIEFTRLDVYILIVICSYIGLKIYEEVKWYAII